MAEAQTATKAKAEVVKVKMEDGREVEFAGKRRMLKEVVLEGDRVGVRFDFRNGQTLMAWVPDQHKLYSSGHGYGQKLGDNVAGLKASDGQSPADEDDMFLEVAGLHERLSAEGSSWKDISEGGGFGGASVLLRALIEHSGLELEKVKEWLKTKSQAEKIAMRDNASKVGKTGKTIKQIVDEMEAAKKAKAQNIDSDALLAGMPTG